MTFSRTDRFLRTIALTAAFVGFTATLTAEPRPLFFSKNDERSLTRLTRTPRKFDNRDSSWQPRLQPRGDISGQTTVTLSFPAESKAVPVHFGIPLGQVPSAQNVLVLDEEGRPIPCDVFPLVNFETSPLHWVMIATTLDAPAASHRVLTVKWGPDLKRPVPDEPFVVEETPDGDLNLHGARIRFTLSPKTLLSNLQSVEDSPVFAQRGSRIALKQHDADATRDIRFSPDGTIVKLYEGPLFKWYRIETAFLGDSLPDFKIHFEVLAWSNSPYLLLRSRLINENQKRDYSVSDLTLLSLVSDGLFLPSASGVGEESFVGGSSIAISQRRDRWDVTADETLLASGEENELGEWVRLKTEDRALTLIAPDFQGFGPGDPDLQSHLAAESDGTVSLVHYSPYPEDGDGAVTFWHTAARTFRVALHLGDTSRSGVEIAAALKQPPSVQWDRAFLTEQGVFNETHVTHTYDEPALEGARYFDRTRARRQDYPRMGRGMPPQKGEGFEHVYTDTGGMLFGEVWQYTNPHSQLSMESQYIPDGNVPTWYEPDEHVGISTYRCADHSLAIAYSYLRTGDRQVFDIFKDHPLLFVDWSIAHPNGGNHYYCFWDAHVHVYSRLAGPLLCYLADGDPWLFEVSEQMAAFLSNDWRGEEHPSDTQTRSVYPCRGLSRLYEITGNRTYWNEAVDRTLWFMETGVRNTGEVRGFANRDERLTPLFAGYSLLGIIPVYERCINEELSQTLRRVGDWLLDCQGRLDDPSNAGTWVRDTIIDTRTNLGPGNSGSTTLCAEILTWLAQTTGQQRYFYGGAAAWANMVTTTRHDGVRGGLPMQTEGARQIGTWSDKLPIYLHRLPAVAQIHGWPFVVEGVYAPDLKPPIVVFVAAGGRYQDRTFTQPLFAANRQPETLSIWSPLPPAEAEYDGVPLRWTFEESKGLMHLTLPALSKPGELKVRFKD